MLGNPFVGNKHARFPERVAEWMRIGETRAPIVVDFDLTNRCPHNCPACPGEWRSDPTAQMSYDDAIDWLWQFAAMDCKAVSFGGGGDPLAHPECVEIIEAARDLGMSVGIITNGAIMSDSQAKRLSMIASWIRVSLDARGPDRWAEIHGVKPDQFDQVLRNIERLAHVKARRAVIGVGFLTNKDSIEEIVPAANLARDLGADYIQYRPFNYDQFDARPQINEASARYATDNFAVLASIPKYGLMGTEKWQKPYKRCHFHHFGAVVTAHGNMHICCDLKSSFGKYGSLKENRVEELWHSREKRDVAAAIDVSKCPPFCRGNCHNLYLDSIIEPITHEEFL